MLKIIYESITIGFISWVIGTIAFNLSINKINKDKNKPYGIDLAFFITGLFLYLIFEKGIFNNLLKSNDKI
jgi:hypothetical protein